MNTNLTFHRSGTGPAGRRAGRAPSLPMRSTHPPRQPAIPDERRWPNISAPVPRATRRGLAGLPRAPMLAGGASTSSVLTFRVSGPALCSAFPRRSAAGFSERLPVRIRRHRAKFPCLHGAPTSVDPRLLTILPIHHGHGQASAFALRPIPEIAPDVPARRPIFGSSLPPMSQIPFPPESDWRSAPASPMRGTEDAPRRLFLPAI